MSEEAGTSHQEGRKQPEKWRIDVGSTEEQQRFDILEPTQTLNVEGSDGNQDVDGEPIMQRTIENNDGNPHVDLNEIEKEAESSSQDENPRVNDPTEKEKRPMRSNHTDLQHTLTRARTDSMSRQEETSQIEGQGPKRAKKLLACLHDYICGNVKSKRPSCISTNLVNSLGLSYHIENCQLCIV